MSRTRLAPLFPSVALSCLALPAAASEPLIDNLSEPYPDCNLSGSLTAADFSCFQTQFVTAHPSADCNASGSLTVADFVCFQGRFVAGCP